MTPKQPKRKASADKQAKPAAEHTGADNTADSPAAKPAPRVLMTEVPMTAKLQGFLIARSFETGMFLYEVASTILESTLAAHEVTLDARAANPNPSFDEAVPCPNPAKSLMIPTTFALHQKLTRLARQSQLSRGRLAAEILADTPPTALSPVIRAAEDLHRRRTADEKEPWSPTMEPFLS